MITITLLSRYQLKIVNEICLQLFTVVWIACNYDALQWILKMVNGIDRLSNEWWAVLVYRRVEHSPSCLDPCSTLLLLTLLLRSRLESAISSLNNYLLARINRANPYLGAGYHRASLFAIRETHHLHSSPWICPTLRLYVRTLLCYMHDINSSHWHLT